MSREKPESYQEVIHWRTQEIIEEALADQELMEAAREGVAAALRGEKGVPLEEVRAQIRAREKQ
jgi:hypothetical protein